MTFWPKSSLYRDRMTFVRLIFHLVSKQPFTTDLKQAWHPVRQFTFPGVLLWRHLLEIEEVDTKDSSNFEIMIHFLRISFSCNKILCGI